MDRRLPCSPSAGGARPRTAGAQDLHQAGEWVPGRANTPSRIPVRRPEGGRPLPRPAGVQDLQQAGGWAPGRQHTPSRIPVRVTRRPGQRNEFCPTGREATFEEGLGGRLGQVPGARQAMDVAGGWAPGQPIPVITTSRTTIRRRREIWPPQPQEVPNADDRGRFGWRDEFQRSQAGAPPPMGVQRHPEYRDEFSRSQSTTAIPRTRGPPTGGDQMRTGTGWAAQLPHLQCPRGGAGPSGLQRDDSYRNEFQQSQSEFTLPRMRGPPTGGDQMRTGTGWAAQLPDLQCPRGTERATGVYRGGEHRNEFQRSQATASQSGVLRYPTYRNEFARSHDVAPPTGVQRCSTYRNEFARSHDVAPQTGVLRCPTYRNELSRSHSEITLPRMRGPPPGGDQMRTGAGWADQLPEIQLPRPVPPPTGVRRDPAYRNEFAPSIPPPAPGAGAPNVAAVMQEVHNIVIDARERINRVVQDISSRRGNGGGQGPCS